MHGAEKPLAKVEATCSTNANLKVESRGEDAMFTALLADARQQNRPSSWKHDPLV